MLGRKDYTREEFDHAKTAIAQQLRSYDVLVKAVGGTSAATKVATTRHAFEAQFFNHLTLALDRYFVHRIRAVAGKDGNPLNEVELLSESIMNNDCVLVASTVIKWIPERSILQLRVGDPIRMSQESFTRLSAAFFAELERKFL